MIPIAAFPRNEWKRLEKHGNEKRTRKRQRQEKKPRGVARRKNEMEARVRNSSLSNRELARELQVSEADYSDEYGKMIQGEAV